MRLVLHELALVLDDLTRNPPVGSLQLFPLEPRRVVYLQLALPWSYPQLPVLLILLELLVLDDVVVLVDPPRPEVLQLVPLWEVVPLLPFVLFFSKELSPLFLHTAQGASLYL